MQAVVRLSSGGAPEPWYWFLCAEEGSANRQTDITVDVNTHHHSVLGAHPGSQIVLSFPFTSWVASISQAWPALVPWYLSQISRGCSRPLLVWTQSPSSSSSSSPLLPPVRCRIAPVILLAGLRVRSMLVTCSQCTMTFHPQSKPRF